MNIKQKIIEIPMLLKFGSHFINKSRGIRQNNIVGLAE